MNRKRPSEDVAHVSKKHSSTSHIPEYNLLTCDTTINSTNIQDTCMIYSEDVSTIKSEIDENIDNDSVHEENENNDIFINENYDKCRKSDDYVSDSELSVSSTELTVENANITNTNNLKHDLIMWAKKYQISDAALTSLVQILRQYPCFSTLSLHIKPFVKTPQEQETYTLDKNKTSNIQTFSQCFTEPDNFQRVVIEKLTAIEMTLNQIENKINIICKKLSISNSELENKENIDVFDNLPLKDENHLKLMETKLKNDPEYRNQMIKQLRRITSENLKTSCVRLMRAILSNEVAAKYSWYGAKKKQAFSPLEICKVIMNVIRKVHADVTDEEISAPIKAWLVHAKARMGKENQKEADDTH